MVVAHDDDGVGEMFDVNFVQNEALVHLEKMMKQLTKQQNAMGKTRACSMRPALNSRCARCSILSPVPMISCCLAICCSMFAFSLLSSALTAGRCMGNAAHLSVSCSCFARVLPVGAGNTVVGTPGLRR